MRQLVAVLCLLLGACASTVQNVHTWRAAAVTAAAVDITTTFQAQDSGAVETNPALGQQRARIVAVNVLVLGAVWYLSRNLPPKQQATVWKWVTALHLGAAAWNLKELRER